MTAPPDEYRVRLTTLCKWPRFSGYGFNLHKRKDELGHFIGFIDPGSPAEHAGLMENDRLHEVNGVNVLNEPHEEVVERIKNDPDEVTLLVVSPDGENYYRERGITIHGGMDHIVHRTCPATQQDFVWPNSAKVDVSPSPDVGVCPADIEIRVGPPAPEMPICPPDQTLSSTFVDEKNKKPHFNKEEIGTGMGRKRDHAKNAKMALKDKHEIFNNL